MHKKWTSFQLIILGILFGSISGQNAPEPVYVGAKACAECHSGKSMGYQHSKWLMSGHSTAYAVLAKPGSKTIAELSGVTQEPQKAAMCLGCHATGAAAEEAPAAPAAEAAVPDWPRVRAAHGGEYALLRPAGKRFPG